MKNNKIKTLVKLARKKAKEDIQTGLVANLKEATVKLGHGSKKIDKKIEKGAKILAKKIAKDLVIDGAALLNEHNVNEAATKAKTTEKKEAAKAKPAKAEAAEVTAS